MPVTEEQHPQLAVPGGTRLQTRPASVRQIFHDVVRLAALVPGVIAPPPHRCVRGVGVILRMDWDVMDPLRAWTSDAAMHGYSVAGVDISVRVSISPSWSMVVGASN